MIKLLKKAAATKVSDLHINVGAPPMVRLFGRLNKLNMPALDAPATEAMLLGLLDDTQRAQLAERMDLDFTYELEGVGRFRANVFKQQRGYDAAFRFIPKEIPSLEELGVPRVVEKMTHYTQGLTLITGPAGSGKTTTLAALIALINRSRKENIICLEEPIEYVMPSEGCNIVQRQIPRDSRSFANALRASLREDPDVIMVGEMRDRDTVSVAVTAAETGHLVLGSLHTSSAARTVDRVLDVFPPREAAQVRAMISESLRGVLAQQLLPRLDNKGRVLACEVMFNTPAISNLIRDSRTFQIPGVIQTQKRAGMQTMDDALKELVSRRVISKDEARLRADNPANFG
jgi:twitching motility protein PilT